MPKIGIYLRINFDGYRVIGTDFKNQKGIFKQWIQRKSIFKYNVSILAYTHILSVISVDIVYIFKALADENRIRILNLLRSGELCGCDIESVLGVKQSNASRHLNRLKIAGIIVSKKKSQWVYYRLSSSIFQRFPFLSIIINDEIEKISVCKEDLELLKKIKESGRTCDWLRNYSVYQKAYRCSFWKNLLYQNYLF